MASNMTRRVAVAAVGIPAALGLVRLGGWPLVAALAAFAALGALEWFRLATARGVRPFTALGAVAAAAVPLVMFGLVRGALPPLWIGFAAVAWLVTAMTAAVLRRPPDAGPLGAVTVTALAPAYTGLIGFILVFRHGAVTAPWAATWLVFLPLVTVWVCDSAAMAAGSAIGGPKFAPAVSPKKTWSGTIAGSVAGAAVAPLFSVLFLRPAGVSLDPGLAALFGFVVASVGQVGDLAESLFKREAGVKDSGGVFPGHGGVLDRFDSLYWALPTGAALLTAFGVL
jgi:phosphatidate cytidylyltransferase